MASIIYQREAPPWKTGGQTIVEYDSGLLRVDQEYTVPTKNLASYLSTFQEGQELEGVTSPAIDGLFIFTAPSWEDRGDGTTSARVSAFGRRYTGLRNIGFELERITPNATYSYSVWRLTGQLVVKSGEEVNLSELEFDEQWLAPFDFNISANPTLTEQSVTLVSERVAGWQAPIYTGSYRFRFKTQKVTQQWSALMSDQQYLNIYLSEPSVRIAGQSNFGNFTELDITTSRRELSNP